MSAVRPAHLSAAVVVLASALAAAFAGCGLSTQGTAEHAGERCSTDAQCKGANPCTVDACTGDGVCTHTAAPDGDAPAATQHPGSCQRSVCKAGVLAVVADDSNVSDDGEACTDDRCQDGKPAHPPKPDTTACKVGEATGKCHAGACEVACGQGLPPCDDQDRCTDDASDVAVGACVFTPLDGVKIPGEKDVAGDCRTPRCVGGTEVLAAVDDSDLPAGESDCVTPTCTNGTPSKPPRSTGATCASTGGAVCDGQGACVACNVEADCTGLPPSTECLARSCDGHACTQAFTAKGTKTLGQTVGDCSVVVCDGAGSSVSQPDDADVPVDPNDCVAHACAGGVPDTHPLAQGTACGLGKKLVCDGAGNCLGCNVPADCQGVDDACKTRTCVTKKCGFDFQPAGTSLPAGQQKAGDCQDLECDGAGSVNAVAKNDDVPADGNDCTGDVCTAGVPSNPPLAPDTVCATGFCDGTGSCGECNDPTQCSPPPLCIAATCTKHVCGTSPIAAGTQAPPAQQTPGDCKDAVCDGKGGTTQAPDVNDLPNDANACTADTCSQAGAPTFSALPAHTACNQGGGKVCDGKSSCVGCVDNSDCSAPNTCGNGVCTCTKKTCAQLGVTCGSVSDGCGGTLQCNDGKTDGAETDVDCGGAAATCAQTCAQGKACSVDGDCATGHCVDGVCCDKACGGACRACTKALTGGLDGTCANMPAGKASDPSKPACPGGDVCGTGGKCRCADGAKDGAETAVDCGGGVCAGCAPASPCGVGADCASTFCADGVCCDQACGALCFACSASLTGGVTGTCSAITPGTDPKNQCTLGAGGAETCAAGGACQCADGAKDGNETDVDCGGSTCAKCALGKKCSANPDCASNVCADGVCCNVACGGACQACTKALNGVADGTCSDLSAGSQPKVVCARPGDVCGTGGKCGCADGVKDGSETDADCGGGVCAACGPGKTCGAPSDCGNTFCVDGYCCNNACTTTCQACAASLSVGANGTCADVKPGLDPHDSCTLGQNGAEVCGAGHKCQCADGVPNGAETDKDCGGPVCNACLDGKACLVGTDCTSTFCGPDLFCHPSTCGDKSKDGTETDVDCGGTACPKCGSGKVCSGDPDCVSNKCVPGTKLCQ